MTASCPNLPSTAVLPVVMRCSFFSKHHAVHNNQTSSLCLHLFKGQCSILLSCSIFSDANLNHIVMFCFPLSNPSKQVMLFQTFSDCTVMNLNIFLFCPRRAQFDLGMKLLGSLPREEGGIMLTHIRKLQTNCKKCWF